MLLDSPDKNTGAQLLDVREDAELMAFALPQAKHIPLGQLRDRLKELDPAKEIITFCAIGVRAYNAARISDAERVCPCKNLSGRSKILSVHPPTNMTPRQRLPRRFHFQIMVRWIRRISHCSHASGLQRYAVPRSIMKVFETMKDMRKVR